MSNFLIRTRDGLVVGTHSGPAAEQVTVPDGETGERFDTREDFEARLAELEPEPGPDPDDEFAQAVESASTLDELKAALLGKGGGNARAAARRADT